MSRMKLLRLSAAAGIAILAIFVLWLTLRKTGHEYYVAPNGSDSNSGTFTQPWASIAFAAKKVLPGDIVYLRGGVYYPIITQVLSRRGTADARIVFQAYQDEKPILDGSKIINGEGNDVVSVPNCSYVDVIGLTIRNGPWAGLTSWGSHHLRFMNNVIYDNQHTGIYVGGPKPVFLDGIEVTGNTVYHNVHMNDAHSISGGWDTGIHLSHVSNSKIIKNLVYENQGEGIVTSHSDGTLISGNVVHDNFSIDIYLERAQNAVIDGNLVYNTGNAEYFRLSQPANSIEMALEESCDIKSDPTCVPMSGNQVINNIVVGGRYGFYYGAWLAGGGMQNVTIANNTFYGTKGPVIKIESDAHANNLITNNIFFGTNTAGSIQVVPKLKGLTFHHNAWYGGSAGLLAGTGDLSSDPLLINPGSFAAADYELKSNSPCIGAGEALTSVVKNFWGEARTAPYNIGAQ